MATCVAVCKFSFLLLPSLLYVLRLSLEHTNGNLGLQLNRPILPQGDKNKGYIILLLSWWDLRVLKPKDGLSSFQYMGKALSRTDIFLCGIFQKIRKKAGCTLSFLGTWLSQEGHELVSGPPHPLSNHSCAVEILLLLLLLLLSRFSRVRLCATP